MVKNVITHDSATVIHTDARLEQLKSWLSEQGYKDFGLKPASQDASFRRYFRMTRESADSLIVMDAPPEQESLSPFIEIAQAWAASDIGVPHTHEFSRELGYLVLEDFGTQTFLNVLDESNLMSHYCSAIDELLRIQTYSGEHVLPEYSESLLLSEMNLFRDWFIVKHSAYTLSDEENSALDSVFEVLCQSALKQKQVAVHRDYHSRNLMLKRGGSVGVIDFQDAVFGPISYDLVSLLKDCYIKLSDEQQADLLNYYFVNTGTHKIDAVQDFTEFKKDFDLMGAQRHLKAIGIFCRLYHRDGKENYLPDIPRTASYLFDLAKEYSDLQVLLQILGNCMQNFKLAEEYHS